MDQRSGDGGFELILDNRKLLVAFALLMGICGVCFVFGFIEGKRQVPRAEGGKLGDTPSSQPVGAEAGRDTRAPSANTSSKSIEDRSVREQLEWYKNVSQRPQGEAKAKAPEMAAKPDKPASQQNHGPAAASAPAEKGGLATSESSASGEAALTLKKTYSVQVGAFTQREVAEAKAALLRAKGYSYTIEPPGSGNSYYSLKVGKFDSRADAVALRLRLKKDGFQTLIKTN